VPEVTEFYLYWAADLSGEPNENAFKSPHASKFDTLGDALEAARKPLIVERVHPWVKADILLFSPGHIRAINKLRDKWKA